MEQKLIPIINAYSDCNGAKAPRNLKFRSEPLSAADLTTIMPLAVPDGYNEFDPIVSIKKLIKYFGAEASYCIAREGSVCIYVKPVQRLWLNRSKPRIGADEVSFEPDGYFRLWWD